MVNTDASPDDDLGKAAVIKAAPPALPVPTPISITVPVTVNTGKGSFERTIVTKHDEQGRIVEFERHQVEEA